MNVVPMQKEFLPAEIGGSLVSFPSSTSPGQICVQIDAPGMELGTISSSRLEGLREFEAHLSRVTQAVRDIIARESCPTS